MHRLLSHKVNNIVYQRYSSKEKVTIHIEYNYRYWISLAAAMFCVFAIELVG